MSSEERREKLVGWVCLVGRDLSYRDALGRECLTGDMEMEHSLKLLDIAFQPFPVKSMGAWAGTSMPSLASQSMESKLSHQSPTGIHWRAGSR